MEATDEKKSSASSPMVILIHGTYARRAAWTGDNAPLVTHLRMRFPKARFRPFLWSGKNSHRARLAAGSELEKVLAETAREFPQAPIMLISHSHGGNVALYALGKSRVSHHVSGLVCLATPFIECKARDLSSQLSYLRWQLPLSLAFLTALLPPALVMVLMLGHPVLGGFAPPFITLLLSIGLAAGAFDAVQKAVDNRLKGWAERKQLAIINELSPPPVPVPVVSAAVARDEAGLWLRSAAAVGELPGRAWRFAFPGFKVILAIWFAVLVLAAVYDVATETRQGTALYMLFSLFVLLPALIVIRILMWLKALLPWAVRGNRWVFGGEGIFHNFLVSISAATSPSCATRSTHHWVNVSGGKGLRHSRLYRDDNFIRKLGDIVGSMLRTAEPTGRN